MRSVSSACETVSSMNVDACGSCALDQMAHLLNSVPHITWTRTAEGVVDFVSDQWAEEYGGDPRRLLGHGWIDFIHPEDLPTVTTEWRNNPSSTHRAEVRVRMPNGAYRWTLFIAKAELDENGSARRWFGTCTDIHERVIAQQSLAENEELYRSVLEASADCIKILSVDGQVQLINTSGRDLMEASEDQQIVGQNWADLWPEAMRETIEASLQSARQGISSRFSGNCRTFGRRAKWWDVIVTPIFSKSGDVIRILSISRDVTVDRLNAGRLKWASEHDALTSLPNRRAFKERLQSAVVAASARGTKVGLLLVDLDHFKTVNDTLGHSSGDMFLKKLAERLRDAIRRQDFVARVGGDEFAIIVEDVASAEQLLRIGDSVAQRLGAPVYLGERALSGGASVGGAIYPDHASGADDLFKKADTALYARKAEGRGGTKMFHVRMKKEAQRVASQLNLARTALNEATVFPVYQPKRCIPTGAIVGFEALLRWSHPEKGTQVPESIEEAFKDYELASRIGHLIQTKVMTDMRRWQRNQLVFGRISINAAPAEFMRDDYAQQLLSRLAQHQVAPWRVELEVTEHVLMERGSEYVRSALSTLADAGLKIALDDFGTGHSSLSHLRDFPVDTVKIDKSFIKRMHDDREICAIVRAVVGLARDLGIRTVAEGVEGEEQLADLRALGCDVAQGFYVGEPLVAEQLETFLGSFKTAA